DAVLMIWCDTIVCLSRLGRRSGTRFVGLARSRAVLAWALGVARLAQPETGASLPVAVMQSNFGLEQETGDIMAQELQTIEEMTHQAARASSPPPALYVWSESAAPGDALSESYPTRRLLSRLAHD